MSGNSAVLGQSCFEVTKQWIALELAETLCTQEPGAHFSARVQGLQLRERCLQGAVSWLFTSFCLKYQLRVVVRYKTREITCK